jgi:outer membrane immunogenic protein
MKTLLMSVAAVTALAAGPAVGADMRLKAPPPGPVISWTGCHIGGFAGLKRTESTHWALGQNVAALPFGTPFTDDFTASGAFAGGTVGCDYQFASPFVIGVEGDIGWSNLHRNMLDVFNPLFHQNLDERWLATVRGRIGFLTGPQGMLYVTAGGAWSSLKSTEFVVGAESESITDTRSGWTAGAGYEALLTPNLSAKVEYLFVDLGTPSFLFAGVGGITPKELHLRLRENVVRLGLNYRFNWGAY